MTTTSAKLPTAAIIHARLSDARLIAELTDEGTDELVSRGLDDQVAQLRAFAERLGWGVLRVTVENDVPDGNGGTKRKRNASAFKRRKITLPDGSTALRVVRPGFRRDLAALADGTADGLLAVDLDRVMRDPRDLEDLIDVVRERKLNARSLSGSMTFTDGGTDSEIDLARMRVLMGNSSSRDNSRRVTAARRRDALAGRFGGGKRRFGFEPDGVTVRTLDDDGVPVEGSEAAVIADCSRRVLPPYGHEDGESLRSMALDLRKREVPTVTGAAWSAESLRDILLRPRNAGHLIYNGEIIGKAPWEPIVHPDVFDAVVRHLSNPARQTGPGPARKWLGSGVYLCGVCPGDVPLEVSGGAAKHPGYRCSEVAHLVRNAAHLDKLVRETVIGIMSGPDVASKLISATRPEVDVGALRTRATAIRTNLDGLARDRALGLIDRAQMLEATKIGHAELTKIDKTLAGAAVGDSAAAKLAGSTDVAAGWDALPLGTQQSVVRELITVTVLKTTKRGSGFDRSAVRIEPKAA